MNPSRIVVRGVNWLGDAVMTTPALLRLRERFPDAHIALLTHEKIHELWKHHPALSEAIDFAADESIWSIRHKLRDKQFDLALILPNSPRSALETWLAKIPQRVGYARLWRNVFLTHAVPSRPGHVTMHKRTSDEVRQLVAVGVKPKPTVPTNADRAHQMHDYLHLVAAIGASSEPCAPRLVVNEDEIHAALTKFDLLSDLSTGRQAFAINPGAEYGPAKRWPAERYVAAAREIQRRTNAICLVLGGKADVPISRSIASAIRDPSFVVRDVSGGTSLRELMALLKQVRVLLTNDSGPMHVAAALGTPVVVPFGSTSPELTEPGLPGDLRNRIIQSDAPCAPCFLRECPIDFRCMNGISVERVVEAALSVLR